MNKELEIKLIEKYPKILRDYGGHPMQTCMAWGMEHDDGWYELLDKCMEKLQYFCDLCFHRSGMQVQVVATQIKEKYGTLSFYTTTNDADSIERNILDDIISEAERKSAYTCEITGKHGEACKKGGWYKTLCYEEARKLGYIACNESTEKYWQTKDTTPKQPKCDA